MRSSVVASLLFAANASADPVAAFTASPVQGASGCIAPCVVHFDATATDDSEYTRDFHTLTYTWDFDDAAVGGTWSLTTGASKNSDRGPIAGHVYTVAGTYDPVFTVRAPDGATDTETASVTVVDPDTRFSSGETYCFSTSATYTGCTGTNVSTSDLDTALTDCFDGGSAERRCRFRGGETFIASASSTIPTPGASNVGMIDSYGTGRATFDCQLNTHCFAVSGNRWTLTNVDLDCTTSCGSSTAAVRIDNEASNFSWTASEVRGMNSGALVAPASSSTNFSDLIAMSEIDHAVVFSGGQVTYCAFQKAARLMLLGNLCDHDGNINRNVRTVHNYKSVIAHNVLQDGGTASLHIRGWGGTAGCGSGSPDCDHGTDPVATDSQYLVVRDNWFRTSFPGATTPGPEYFIRICQNNECGTPGAVNDSSAEMQDFLIEDNFFSSTATIDADVNSLNIAQIQGGDITVRNNVMDLQGLGTGSDSVTIVAHASEAADELTNNDEIHVIGNTAYWADATTGGVTFCSGGSVGSSHVCQLNLLYAPNQSTGTFVDDDGGSWSVTTGNDILRSPSPNPFSGTPASLGSTTYADFTLSGSSTAKDKGVTVDSASSLNVDFTGKLRPVGTSRDAGALEEGVTGTLNGLILQGVRFQ